MILYFDNDLVTKLDQAIPAWREQGWIAFDTQEKLIRICEAAMMFMDDNEL